MFNTTESYKEQVKKLPQNWRMDIEVILDASAEDITLETENSESLETETEEIIYFPAPGAIIIPADDIFESGFAECVFLSTFGIGTSIRPNWWVRIFNENSKYVNDTLAKAEFHPRFTLYDDDGNVTDTVPVGVFHTDKITIQDNDLRIDCFDKMGYLEKLYVPQNARLSLYQIAGKIALGVRAQLLSTPTHYSLLKLTVDDSIFMGYSQKQVLELIATALGCFVQFDNNGNLVFKWFSETDVELSGDYANTALSLNGNTFSLDGNVVKVTGVRVVNEDTELAMMGTDDYLLTINENPIAAFYPTQVAKFVLTQMQKTKYIPCEWRRIGGDPSLQLGDIITIIDNKEPFNEENYEQYDKYPLYMTGRNWTYNVGGFSDVYTSSGNAEKDLNTDKGMTQSKRMAQLAKRITETKKDLTAEMDSRQEFLLLFNETIAASIGFYTTCVTDDNGAVIQYMHDKPLLEDSGTIYTKGINGFAWTNDGWNDGEPLWQYGFDKNGNAILNQIYTYNLTADVIVSGLLQSKNGASWIDMDTGEFQFGTTANKPVLSLVDTVLNVYGILKSLNFPNLSVSIGESENGNFGAFTVSNSKEGYGDLFQIYGVASGDEKGVVLTAPFLINNAKTNRKGIAIFPTKIRMFNDKGAIDGKIGQFTLEDGIALMSNGRAYIEQVGADIRMSNGYSRNLWINWGSPNHGYTPTQFIFGDGTEGGTADVRLQSLRALEHVWTPQILIGPTEDGGWGEYALSVVGGCIVDSGKFDWMAHADKFPGLTTPDDSYHGVTYAEKFGLEGAYITKATAQLMRDLGSIQSPQNAFYLNLGLETLHLRMKQHCENGLAVAKYLKANDKVAWVHYADLEGDEYNELAKKYMPNGTCGVLAFGIKGGREASIKFMDSLKFASIVTHVADAKTCLLHPASHTHRQMSEEQLIEAGVAPDLIRLSVGIENVEDLIADLEQAFAQV